MPSKSIVGYTDRLSVRAGDRQRFMISADPPGPYRAEMVKLICGDPDAFQERPVAWPGAGEYIGEPQPIQPGSYGLVAEFPALTAGTICLYVMPTLLDAPGEQTLVDLGGHVRLTIADAGRLVENEWQWLIFHFDGAPAGWLKIGGQFNGRIELLWIANEVLDPVEARALSEHPERLRTDPRIVAAWDFSQEMESSRFIDVTGHGFDGKFFNTPTRALRGVRWDGSEQDWKRAPAHYGAVHFHADDLTDARWQPSIEWTVPDDLASGVYAMKLSRADDEDYSVFFVRPRPGGPKRKTAFLASTATYLAYANNRFSMYAALIEQREPGVADAYLRDHPEVGLSLYERHTDGSGVHYSSWLRPVLDLKPKGRLWSFNADTNITAWLEHTGVEFDVVTDEDLHRDGAALLDGYSVVITGAHPEYASTRMLDGVEGYLRAGGRLMYMGGNGFYWRVAYDRENPAIIELRRAEGRGRAWDSEPGEYYHSFTGEYGGLWRLLGRPPNRLVGVGFVALAQDDGSPYTRRAGARDPRARFIFEGTTEGETFGNYGSVCGGAVSQEIDRANPLLGSPRHTLILAGAESLSRDFMLCREESDALYRGVPGPKLRADMTFFETPAGGAVFSTGSIGFAGALAHNGYANDICRIAKNVLDRFLDPAPFVPPQM